MSRYGQFHLERTHSDYVTHTHYAALRRWLRVDREILNIQQLAPGCAWCEPLDVLPEGEEKSRIVLVTWRALVPVPLEALEGFAITQCLNDQ